ncbi:cuticular protein 47Eg-like [Teleopsis dalmanni]|uniref:cuticular protein 47Eg-like n=1 Tax=Teleopsis dalmanni TaxID=139649 RepID=UPI0018CE00AD|nr:cuticular protein 47Eg-like [Teleopsis dalmanni]XP_037956607.1 cuticular protein 47Eg-like [Teleopsis dalmanni]
MKFFVVFACLLAVAFAGNDVNVIRSDAEVNVDNFKYAYEFDNSIKAEQQGNLKGEDTWVVNGQYSYTSPEGEQVSLAYTADENGYHVDAANPLLPTPPPIPAAILRSLEWIAAHPSKE